MTVCFVGWIGTKNNMYQFFMHTFIPPDDGPRYARNM